MPVVRQPERRSERSYFDVRTCLETAQLTCVTAVTVWYFLMGETSIVNMVQRVSKKTLLEPGDTRQQWKGEAAASFVCIGITSSRALPTSSAGYWSPLFTCSNTGASEVTYSFGGVFLPKICQPHIRQPRPARLLSATHQINRHSSPPLPRRPARVHPPAPSPSAVRNMPS